MEARAAVGLIGWSGAGFFLGLGVQTHITAVLLLPGAALALLLQRPGLCCGRAGRSSGRWRSLLATANLLVYNVQTGGGSLRGGQAVLSDYTGQDEACRLRQLRRERRAARPWRRRGC